MSDYSLDEARLEQAMADLGFARYARRQRRAVEGQSEGVLPSHQNLLRQAVSRVTIALTDWKKAKAKGRRVDNVVPLTQAVPATVALVTCQFLLDSLSRERLYNSLVAQLGSRVEDELRYQAFRRAARKEFNHELKRATRQNLGYASVRQRLMAAMKRTGVAWQPWTKKQRMVIGMVLLELVIQSTGLVEVVVRIASGPKLRQERVVVVTKETLAWIEKSGSAAAAFAPYYTPTVDTPVPWQSLTEGGYHTNLLYRKPLVKSRSRSQRRELSPVSLATSIQAVNALQGTAWEVNPFVYRVMLAYGERGQHVCDLPSREDEALPPKPTSVPDRWEEAVNLKDPEVYAMRRAWLRAYWGAKRRNLSARSRRLQHAHRMVMATRFLTKRFYYPHQLDFRGRAYPVPHFLSPQGSSEDRGLLRFGVGARMVDEDAERWLAIYGANCWGHSKVSFADRARWVEEHEQDIMAVAADPEQEAWWQDASAPWEFLAFCDEWARFKAAKPGTFVGRLPLRLDGTNNGLQVYSLLLRDEVAGAATNCLPSDLPRDIYQDVADVVTERLRLAAVNGDQTAKIWLSFVDGRVPREAAKRPVMTLPYGVTIYSARKYVLEWAEERAKEMGDTPFGYELAKATSYLTDHLWEAIHAVVRSARVCMDWLREVADAYSAENLSVAWTTPSGFVVVQSYQKWHSLKVQTTLGHGVRRAKMRQETAEVNRVRQANAIAPNFVHSLDAAAMVGTVCTSLDRGANQLTAIHDSFGAPAAQLGIVYQAVRDAYAEMFSRDVLAAFRDEVQGPLKKHTLSALPAYGKMSVTEVLESAHFFS